jgi:hypothetical protein
MLRVSYLAVSAASLVLCLSATAANADDDTLSHIQDTTHQEFIGSEPTPLAGAISNMTITVTNSTRIDWTDYRFIITASDGDPFAVFAIKSITVPANPFENGKRQSTTGGLRKDSAVYYDGTLSPGDSFTANFVIRHGDSVNIIGEPSFGDDIVPEPAAWITMLLGFGAAGAAARGVRRRAARPA